MRVRVNVDAVVLDGLRVPARDRAALLARLEAELADQLAALPAQVWSDPADALTEPVRAAVSTALAPARPVGRGRPAPPSPAQASSAPPSPGTRS